MLNPLHNLFENEDLDREIAFGPGGVRCARDLLKDAGTIAESLPEPISDSHVLLVFRNDRYFFAAALLAAWMRGHTVALPPNTRRGAILRLKERPDTVAVLHDTDSGLPHRVQTLLGAQDRHSSNAEIIAALESLPEPLATVFTSGSTGDMTACPKTSDQLLGEAIMLQTEFFGRSAQRIVSTVPPGHIYGLLYSVLAPLLGGHSFLRDTPLLPESVASRLSTFHAQVLVTVPAHLRTLVSPDAEMFGSVQRVLSSTAPLATATAQEFQSHTGLDITEVLGSSETGGIAWRLRSRGEDFKPLPNVKVSLDSDGRLLIDSPYVDAHVTRPYVSSDIAELHPDGTFRHIGRADGIIKVGGRRVSLPEMQRWLTSADGIDDAAVTSVETSGSRGHSILAAVVTDARWTQGSLLTAMSEHFERSSLPRRVVFADELPREDNGKIQRTELLRMFDLDADGSPIQWDLKWAAPTLTDGDEEESVFACEIDVPERYAWFEGHFEGYPVMAAAVQLQQIVAPSLKLARPDVGDVRRITRMKFTGRIQPGDSIVAEIRWTHDETNSRFVIRKGKEICSTGMLDCGAPS